MLQKILSHARGQGYPANYLQSRMTGATVYFIDHAVSTSYHGKSSYRTSLWSSWHNLSDGNRPWQYFLVEMTDIDIDWLTLKTTGAVMSVWCWDLTGNKPNLPEYFRVLLNSYSSQCQDPVQFSLITNKATYHRMWQNMGLALLPSGTLYGIKGLIVSHFDGKWSLISFKI